MELSLKGIACFHKSEITVDLEVALGETLTTGSRKDLQDIMITSCVPDDIRSDVYRFAGFGCNQCI